MTGAELRVYRIRLAIEPAELARRCGLTRDSIWKMENGVMPVSSTVEGVVMDLEEWARWAVSVMVGIAESTGVLPIMSNTSATVYDDDSVTPRMDNACAGRALSQLWEKGIRPKVVFMP